MKYAIFALFFVILFNLLAYSKPHGQVALSSAATHDSNSTYVSDVSLLIDVGKSNLMLRSVNGRSGWYAGIIQKVYLCK